MMETTHDYGHSFCLRDVRGVGDRDQRMTQEVAEVGQWVEAGGREIRFPGTVNLTTWVLLLVLDMMAHLSIFDILTFYMNDTRLSSNSSPPHIHPLNLSPRIIFKIETSTF